ncbi:MAG: hypothetical protein AAF533_08820 [Acidobacteriota bacterium]
MTAPRERQVSLLVGRALLCATLFFVLGFQATSVSAQGGACCLAEVDLDGDGIPDGPGCLVLDPVDCLASGGIYQGDGVDCDPMAGADCTITGACCVATMGAISCFELTEAECAASGGDYSGDGTGCDDLPCSDPVGACCYDDPMTGWEDCYDFAASTCSSVGGEFEAGTSCAVDPPCSFGACCLGADGACGETIEADCTLFGGIHHGVGTSCETVSCSDELFGACCVTNPMMGTTECLELSASDCAAAGGEYGGDGTGCTATSCGAEPTGACCLPDTGASPGGCEVLGWSACHLAGGFYLGDDTACEPTTCDALIGACCLGEDSDGDGLPDSDCEDLTLPTCEDLEGNFQGMGTSCADPTTTCLSGALFRARGGTFPPLFEVLPSSTLSVLDDTDETRDATLVFFRIGSRRTPADPANRSRLRVHRDGGGVRLDWE